MLSKLDSKKKFVNIVKLVIRHVATNKDFLDSNFCDSLLSYH